MRIAAVPIRALVSHTRSQVFEVQKVDRAVSRSLSFWSPWRSAKTIHPAETGPSPLKRPAERSAYGVRWRDDYSWMESSGKAFTRHLTAEQHYAVKQCNVLRGPVSMLRQEMLAKSEAHTQTHAETWGSYSYYTEQTKERPLVAYMRQNAQGDVDSVLDVNDIQANSNLISVGQVKLEPNQQLVAYTVDTTSGGESYEALVQTIGGQATEVDRLVDVISIEWAGSKAVVYTQGDAQGRPAKAMLHYLGQPQQQDQCLLHEAKQDCFLELAMTLSGSYVTVNSNTKTSSEVYLLATDKPSACLTLVQPRTPGLQYFVAHHQASLLLLTNHGSKQDYQVMTAPLSSPGISNWQTAVPHRSHTAITDIDVFATHAVLYERQQGRPAISLLPLPVDHHRQAPTHLAAASKHQTASSSSRGLAREDNQLDDSSTECSGLSTCNSVHKLAGTSTNFCSYAKQAKSLAHCAVTDAVTAQAHNGLSPMQQVQSYAVESHAQQGTAALHSTTLPKWVMALEPGGNPDYHSGTVRLHLSSPVHPQHVYDCHLESGGLELLGTQQVAGHNPEDYVCSMHHAVSPDGTEVPVTIAHKKGLKLDGGNPALVTVYGSYGICLDAGFQPERLSLLDRGWTIVLAHVRGGGELGRQWHADGQASNMLNSVLDLEACLDMLHTEGYSRKGLVALEGTSAGGLLVGALLNRRPESLFAAILRVPFVDLLTTMTQPDLPLTIHEYEEWGDPADPSALHLIQEICPYHNIKSAVYPHILVTCSSSDVRVPACGPAKWVAKLREHQEGTAPVLLLSNANAGHFGHEADLVDNTALEYAFLLQALLQSTNKDRHSGSCSG